MTVAYPRSEVVLSTDPERLVRRPKPPAEEVIRVSRLREVEPRTPREWHRIFGADGEAR